VLPIALTCPVWWVARWTARTLATLAVLVACSFGAATLPLGGAATAPVAATAVASAEGLPLRTGVPEQFGATADRATADQVTADRPTADRAIADQVSAAPALASAGQDVRGGTVDAPGLPTGEPRPAAALAAVTRATDRPLVPAGLVPATVGSRAPPTR
jgi:hypothetical protein